MGKGQSLHLFQEPGKQIAKSESKPKWDSKHSFRWFESQDLGSGRIDLKPIYILYKSMEVRNMAYGMNAGSGKKHVQRSSPFG